MSKILLPFSVDKWGLPGLLDSHIPDNLFDSKQDANIPFDLVIVKKEITDLDIRGDIIYLSLSVEINAKKGKIYSQGILAMNIETKLIFEDDKIIKTQSRLNDFNWITKPSVNISFIKIPITPVVEEYIKKNSANWFVSIDNYVQKIIQEHYNKVLRTIKSKIFLQKSILRLDLNINEIKFAYFRSEKEYFYSQLYVEFDNTLVKYGKNENIGHNIPKLSWIQEYQKEEKTHFKIVFKNDMINFLSKWFYERFYNHKAISIGGKEIKITDLQGSCSEGKLIFNAQYSGYFSGTAQLSFIPEWIFPNKKIKLKSTDLKIDTEDFMPRIIMFFFIGKIREKIIAKIETLVNTWIQLKTVDIEVKLSKIDRRNELKISDYDFPISINENDLILESFLSFDYCILIDDIKICSKIAS